MARSSTAVGTADMSRLVVAWSNSVQVPSRLESAHQNILRMSGPGRGIRSVGVVFRWAFVLCATIARLNLDSVDASDAMGPYDGQFLVDGDTRCQSAVEGFFV